MYITTKKPNNCEACSFSKGHTIKRFTNPDGKEEIKLGRRCEKLEVTNFESDKTVLENCPLPDENVGNSEEEYTTMRE